MTISDRTLVRIVRAAVAAGAMLAVGGVAVVVSTGRAHAWWPFGAFMALLSVFFGGFVWLVITKHPRNPVVWTMATSALFSALYAAGWTAALLIVDDPGLMMGAEGVPADLPAAAAWILVVAEPMWIPAIAPAMTFGLLLFPDGKLPSPRWRWVGYAAGLGIALSGVGAVWGQRPWNTEIATDDPILNVGQLIFLLAAIASLAALIASFRHSSGSNRQQLKWIVWGASIFVVAIIVSSLFGGGPQADLVYAPLLAAEAIFLTSYGIAVGKYRLYDIDIVISKTVAYVSLAIVIAAIYVAAVFALVALFGDPNQPVGDLGAEFWFGATALVAIVFEPLRMRLQRLANRVAYGKRAAPHEVLSQLASKLSDAFTGEGLEGLAQLLREGTGADSAFVWLRVGERLRLQAASPSDAQPSNPDVVGEQDLPASELEMSVAVRHEGEVLGALGIAKPRSHPVTPADRDLLADVGAGAGLLLRNLRLNAELAARARQLQASRRRLITAQDSARHRLERDLHDGAQQQVVALKVRLGLAKSIAEREGVHEVALRVGDLADATQQAVDEMRAVARGIYPPLLDVEGLGPALATAHRSVELPLELDLGELPRYAKEIEETIYFCVLAAVNRARMAGATQARVGIRGDDASLVVTTAYDSADRGDMAALTDRVEAFGGAITTVNRAEGTTLTMAFPVGPELMVHA